VSKIFWRFAYGPNSDKNPGR